MASDDTLLAVDPMGIVVEWSPQAQSLFGIAAAEIVGGPVAALLAGAWPGRDGVAAEAVESVVAHGLLVRPMQRPDSSTAWAAHLPAAAREGEEPPQALVGPDVPLRRLAFASNDRRLHSLSSGTGPFRFPNAWTQCLTNLQPQLVAYARDETTPEPGGALSPAPHPSGSHPAVVAPLILRGSVLGTLSLFRASDRDAFGQEDLNLALELATRLSLQIDNGRRYTREHTITLTLQRRLLPSHPPEQATLETARFHLPGGNGGGWFDVIPLSGARRCRA